MKIKNILNKQINYLLASNFSRKTNISETKISGKIAKKKLIILNRNFFFSVI